jgi:hypothetical protein
MSKPDPRGWPSADRPSLYNEITGKILAELEAGRLPWVQPWGTVAAKTLLARPTNAATGRGYSGINVLILWGAVISVLSTCRTAAMRRRGAFSGRSAAMPGSAISRRSTIAPERSARYSDDDMAWRGQLWRLATPSWIKTRRFRYRADLNRYFMILLRRRVGRCAFSARSPFRNKSVLAADGSVMTTISRNMPVGKHRRSRCSARNALS